MTPPSISSPVATTAAARLPDFTSLVDRVGPSVVNISTVGTTKMMGLEQGDDEDNPLNEFLKRFGVGDRTGEFRVDIINLFNRSGLGGPSTTNLSDPNFGKIFSVGQGARRLQLSFRATF